LFRDDAKPIYQNPACSLGSKDLPSIMEDNGGLAKTGPGMLTSIDTDQMLFPWRSSS
jgi:hypothetical protein